MKFRAENILFIPFLWSYCQSFEFEINWWWYKTCNIVVSRPSASKVTAIVLSATKYLTSNYIEKNQHAQITWQIRDTELFLYEMVSYIKSHENISILLSHTYGVETFRHRVAERSCAIVITTFNQLMTGMIKTTQFREEHDYIGMWGMWLSYIRFYRKCSLFLPSETTIVFSISHMQMITWLKLKKTLNTTPC